MRYLVAALLVFLFAVGSASASEIGICESEELLCQIQCDNAIDDCLAEYGPGVCFNFDMICRSHCLDAYQTCRWSQPI